MLKYHLVLLGLITFLVILSKCYLSCITSLHCELSLTFIFSNKAGVVVVVVVVIGIIYLQTRTIMVLQLTLAEHHTGSALS